MPPMPANKLPNVTGARLADLAVRQVLQVDPPAAGDAHQAHGLTLDVQQWRVVLGGYGRIGIRRSAAGQIHSSQTPVRSRVSGFTLRVWYSTVV